MADDAPRSCCHGIAGCQQILQEGQKGTLCLTCAEEAFEDEDPPAGCDAWSAETAALELHRRGHKLLDENGEIISDWARRADAVEAAAARSRLDANLLFNKDDLARDVVRQNHPEKKDGERERLFASAYKMHIMAALVAFAEEKKRKPKGEEIHAYLHETWTRYLRCAANRTCGLIEPPGIVPAHRRPRVFHAVGCA